MSSFEPPEEVDKPREPYWLFRRAEQKTVAGLILLSLGVLTFYGIDVWRRSHGVIDIDHAAPLNANFRVDLNQAGWPEISQIPDVGETLARRIVEVRVAGGPYRDSGDLRRRVRGIGPKTLDKITPYLLPIDNGEARTAGSDEK
ncbi:MAG TPA: helix-hairpin-helix domain-containing protein [Pirellulales bacterium]|jgi:competence protein ComEA|nr:helix-hairpin-helix domain-containing protein [Pirellulales bacterium]